MSTISSQALIEQLNWRYATKKFDTNKKISNSDWANLEKAMQLSPSSFGLQPWRFIIVSDPSLRKQLRDVAWGQAQVTDASHLVVFARQLKVEAKDVEHLISRTAELRKISKDSLADYKQMMLGFVQTPAPQFDASAWTARQVYIALGVFLTSAALLGIDACPMEGFDPAKFDEILGLSKKGLSATVMVTAGYRASDDAYAGLAKVRYAAEEVIERV